MDPQCSIEYSRTIAYWICELAALYGVKTGALNRAVSRNKDRFPEDFCFHLKVSEWDDLK
jgi:hypothetical protein